MMYQETVQKINSISSFGREPSLERMRTVLGKLGNPHRNLKFVHVAGTNGKGTSSSYIASCLTESGYKTGLFTSPYVENFTERFKIDGKEIPQKELTEKYEEIKQFESELNQFEFITVLAFLWFAEQECDAVVLEVGLGGKFDATNIIDAPLVELIMSISLDHTAVLGNTVAEIAHEKAGIIKENSDIVLYPKQEQDVFDVIHKVAKEKNARVHNPSVEIEVLSETLKGSKVKIDNIELEIPFSGYHQVLNASTALTAIRILQEKGYKISEKDIQNGFAKTRITARAELLCEEPIVILDGGHNEGCSVVLKELLQKHLSGRKMTAIIGMMADKDCEKYLLNVAPLFEKIITVKPNNPRAIDANELKTKALKYCNNVQTAQSVQEAVEMGENSEVLVICGSLFLAGEIRKYFINKT